MFHVTKLTIQKRPGNYGGKVLSLILLAPGTFQSSTCRQSSAWPQGGFGGIFLLSLEYDTEKDRYQELEAKRDL